MKERRSDRRTAENVDLVLLAQSTYDNQAARTLAAHVGLNTMLLIRILHHRTSVRKPTE